MAVWLALSFHRVGLELRWRSGADPAPAQAIYDPAPASHPLLAINLGAAAAGIQVGHSQVQAQALKSDLLLYPRQPLAESNALAQLATWAYRYSAEVRLEPPAQIALELGGSLSLFGGLSSLLDQLRDDLQQLGFSAAGGLGLSLPAARLRSSLAVLKSVPCALAQPGDLDHLPPIAATPVALLPIPATAVSVLEGSGIVTLGALIKVPAAALKRRFGADVLVYLQRLRNERPEPGQNFQPPQRYQAELELPAPTELGDGLWFPVRRLIADLCMTLLTRDLAVDLLRLEFELEYGDDGREQQVSLRAKAKRVASPPAPEQRLKRQHIDCHLVEPSRDPGHLFELCKQRMERTKLSGKVLSIKLLVPRLPPPSVFQSDLFSSADKQRADWPKLIERLGARLGRERLRQPQAVADLRPERAAATLPWAEHPVKHAHRVADAASTNPDTESLNADLATRPGWLLAQPLAIDPADVCLLSEAERIEGGWWDGDDVRRDYYRALHVNGGHCWVYQQIRPPQTWFVHGWFG